MLLTLSFRSNEVFMIFSPHSSFDSKAWKKTNFQWRGVGWMGHAKTILKVLRGRFWWDWEGKIRHRKQTHFLRISIRIVGRERRGCLTWFLSIEITNKGPFMNQPCCNQHLELVPIKITSMSGSKLQNCEGLIIKVVPFPSPTNQSLNKIDLLVLGRVAWWTPLVYGIALAMLVNFCQCFLMWNPDDGSIFETHCSMKWI